MSVFVHAQGIKIVHTGGKILSTYSRVHISWNKAFFKILKKPSIVQEKMVPHMNLLGFFHTEKPKKKFFNQ